MLGKTHMVVGIATTLAVTQPDTMTGLVTAVGVGALGALISDIDVGTSKSHKETYKIAGLFFFVLAVMAVVDGCFALGLFARIRADSGTFRPLVGLCAFFVICLYGMRLPHRTFMHSFPGLLLLGMSVALIEPLFVPYFAIGFLSHLATDSLNYKKVRLFYPAKGGICLGLFHAHGFANHVMFVCGSVLSGVEIAAIVLKMF